MGHFSSDCTNNPIGWNKDLEFPELDQYENREDYSKLVKVSSESIVSKNILKPSLLAEGIAGLFTPSKQIIPHESYNLQNPTQTSTAKRPQVSPLSQTVKSKKNHMNEEDDESSELDASDDMGASPMKN